MTSDILKQIWPEWEIENPLGRGSYGVVYKAVRSDHNVKSYAAIKVISIPSDPSEVDSLRSEGLDINATRTFLHGIVDDFVNEIQLMESLKGIQNIVSVEDYKVVEKTDEIGWDIYIRMELLTPFNTYICDKKLTEEEVIKLGCDICTALEICGQRNIIHRDIKPENIFINDFGHFKLGDFGIARKLENLTGGLSQKGTFNYMAPEIATGSDYDSRVDIYSLGIVLYRLLNGNRLPFLDTEKQLLNPNERRNAVDRRLRGEALPAPCDASPAMANLILCACAHDPDMRFSSATAMKNALMNRANGTHQETQSGDPNGTISVRRVPAVSNQQDGQSVNIFGEVPKKKLKLPVIIGSVLAVAVIIIVGIFTAPKFINNDGDGGNSSKVSDKSVPETSEYSEFKEKTLKEAEDLAASGNYASAIKLLKDAQNTYSNDADFQSAYKSYCSSYKSIVIGEADILASNGNYDGAYKKINEAIDVLGEDTELTQKSRDYQLDSYIGRADAYAENNNFDEALAALDTAEQVLGGSSVISQKKGEIQRTRFYYQLNQYDDDEDYEQAIKFLNSNNGTYGREEAFIEKSNFIKVKYREQTLSTAAEKFGASGYSAAIDVLNKGLTVLPGDTTFLEKIEEYEKYIPINLFSLDYFNSSDNSYNIVKGPYVETDNIGEVHSGSYEIGIGYGDDWATYRINGNYSKLTGSFYILFENRSTKTDSILNIYGDDKLLYTVTITGGKEPVDFTVDISGVNYLKISYYWPSTWSRPARLSDVCLFR